MPEVPHSNKRRFFAPLDAPCPNPLVVDRGNIFLAPWTSPAPIPWWSTFFQGGTSSIVYPGGGKNPPLYHLPDEQLHKFDIILGETLVFAQIIIGVFLYRIHVGAGVLIWQCVSRVTITCVITSKTLTTIPAVKNLC